MRTYTMRWVIVAIVVGGVAVAALIARSRAGRGGPNMGAVSDRWIAEHRTDHPHN